MSTPMPVLRAPIIIPVEEEYKLTCKVGTFYFPADTPLSHAKLIRDAMMKGMLAPEKGARRINRYRRDHVHSFGHLIYGPAENVEFEFVPAGETR